MGAFIWSHIPRQDLAAFIRHINQLVRPGGSVVFMDNRYVPASSTTISYYDQHGNGYQTRRLQNGEEYAVLKNFPERTDLEAMLATESEALIITESKFFWICQYRVKATD